MSQGTPEFTPEPPDQQVGTLTKFWLPSISEKDFMYSQISSDVTDKGVLKSEEGSAEQAKTQALLKPHLPPPRGPEGEQKQSR